MDRRAESVADSRFIITGSALQPVLATTLVSQTLTEWAMVLQQALTSSQVPQAYVELANPLAVLLRQVYWLKCYSASQTSKRALVDLSLKGTHLFGATLDDIIKNLTSGKSTFLPQAKKGKELRWHKWILHSSGSSGKGTKPF